MNLQYSDHHAAIYHGLTPPPPLHYTHLCSQDHKSLALSDLLMECIHLHDRKVTTDVRVEHKEPSGISPHDLITEVIDTPCSA